MILIPPKVRKEVGVRNNTINVCMGVVAMKKKSKIILMMVAAMVVSTMFVGCGPVEKEEPNVPTQYIEKADDAVEEYNKNVEKLNETGNSVDENTVEE